MAWLFNETEEIALPVVLRFGKYRNIDDASAIEMCHNRHGGSLAILAMQIGTFRGP